MAIDVRIPTLGESVTDGVIMRWMKTDGDVVEMDEPLLELETDKASVEIPAEVAGVLHIIKPQGVKVQVGDVVARIEAGAPARPAAAPPPVPVSQEARDETLAYDRAPSSIVFQSPTVRRLIEEYC